jgi:hypothetical protein
VAFAVEEIGAVGPYETDFYCVLRRLVLEGSGRIYRSRKCVMCLVINEPVISYFFKCDDNR